MSSLYKAVFQTYPFPIDDPAYLQHMMNQGMPYYAIRNDGHIAALAATEIDRAHQNAEMTDFATLPKWRGLGYAGVLLDHMEQRVNEVGIKTVYTIARVSSKGMNAVFQNRGYTYSGLLKNNSQICGAIQSMTIWHKHLSALQNDLT
jgi:putative beta-lysine N-acetyltransferase